jgi:hypothetical protein
MQGVIEFLFSIPLQFGLGIGALILAGMLPKTGPGKALAMLIAFGMVWANWRIMVNTDRIGHSFNPSYYLVWPGILMCITVSAIVLIASLDKGKKPFALLPVAGTLFIFFILGSEQWMELLLHQYQRQQQAAREKAAEQKNQRRQQYFKRLADEKEEGDKFAKQALQIMPEICKKAVDVIHSKAENVDGVLLLDGALVRASIHHFFDSYHYIDQITDRGEWKRYGGRPTGTIGKKDSTAYKIKLIKNRKHHQPAWDKDLNYQRYIADFIASIASDHVAPPRYALIGGEVSTLEERKNHIYGHSLKVVDLQTKEVMAERISYQFWYHESPARSGPLVCPQSAEMEFIAKVLRPAPIRLSDEDLPETFSESCKKSGEFIHRKTEKVYGILWLPNEDFLEPVDFVLNWPAIGGKWKIKHFRQIDHAAYMQGITRFSYDYSYVDIINGNGQWSRYYRNGTSERVGEKNPAIYNINLDRAVLGKDSNYDQYIQDLIFDKSFTPYSGPPRYAVTGNDITTSEEKLNGITGRSLKIIDLQTKEVMAERIRYLYQKDRSKTLSCPPFSVRVNADWKDKLHYEGLQFVGKVLGAGYYIVRIPMWGERPTIPRSK